MWRHKALKMKNIWHIFYKIILLVPKNIVQCIVPTLNSKALLAHKSEIAISVLACSLRCRDSTTCNFRSC